MSKQKSSTSRTTTVADIEARGVPRDIAEQAIALLKASEPVDLAIEVAIYREVRRFRGRPMFKPRTDDGKLIAEALAASGLTLAELARVIGADRSVLSRANDPVRAASIVSGKALSLLSDERRRQLERLRDALGGGAS